MQERTPAIAIRVVLRSEGGKTEFSEAKKVEMVLPPHDHLPGTTALSGFWFELRDKNNKTIYRRIIHNTGEDQFEVVSENEKEQLFWKRTGSIGKLMVLWVPFLEEADHIAIVRGMVDSTGYSVKETARFVLKDMKID